MKRPLKDQYLNVKIMIVFVTIRDELMSSFHSNVWHHVLVVKGVGRKEVAGSFLQCEYLLAFVLRLLFMLPP